MYRRSGKRGNTASKVKCFLIMLYMKKHSHGKVYRDGNSPHSKRKHRFKNNGIGYKQAKSLSRWFKKKVMIGVVAQNGRVSLGFCHSSNRRARGQNVTLVFFIGFASLCLDNRVKPALLPLCLARRINIRGSPSN